MGDSVSSIGNAFGSISSIGNAVGSLASGASSIGQAMGGVYSEVNDYAHKQLEIQSGKYAAEMEVIGANLEASNMELQASQMDSMSETQVAIGKFKEAAWTKRAGDIALSALFEEQERREEMAAVLANQNLTAAANGVEGMSTTAFVTNSINKSNRAIMKMKWAAFAEAEVSMQNGRMERLQSEVEASQLSVRAANTRIMAGQTRFGGAMRKTARLLESRSRGLSRGVSPTTFSSIDKWVGGGSSGFTPNYATNSSGNRIGVGGVEQ
jgi:hypothetical protein